VTIQQRPVKKEQGFQAVWPNKVETVRQGGLTLRCRRHGPFSDMTPRRSMSANGGGADLIARGLPSTEG